jgi:hypothetical protein
MTEFASGDTVFAAIGTGATNYLWLGQSFPNSSNYLFASGSSSTYILGTTYLQLAANNGASGIINLSSTAITESIGATQIALGNTSGWTLSPGGTAAAGTATAAAAQYVWNPATTIVAGGSQQNKINRYVWNTYSSNSVANTVGTITPSNGQGILVHGYNIGRLHSSPYTAYASECAAAFSEASGSVSQAGTATVLATFGSGSTCGISASGGSIYPTVTGGTTSQIDWTTIADVIQE